MNTNLWFGHYDALRTWIKGDVFSKYRIMFFAPSSVHQLPAAVCPHQTQSERWRWQVEPPWSWSPRGTLTTNPPMTTASFIVMAPSALASKCLVSKPSSALHSSTWKPLRWPSVTVLPLCHQRALRKWRSYKWTTLWWRHLKWTEMFWISLSPAREGECSCASSNNPQFCFLSKRFIVWLTGASWFSSLPKEVCSVILDAECLRPIQTACNMVEPSKECQLVLRHFFNDSGVYCINVSMANDVSLAATSAKVNVDIGTQQNHHTAAHRLDCLVGQ